MPRSLYYKAKRTNIPTMCAERLCVIIAWLSKMCNQGLRLG